MTADIESLFSHTSPMQYPLEYLDAHAWGCAWGVQLNMRARRDLAASLAGAGQSSAVEDDLRANIRAMLTMMECYSHIQVCKYCVPIHAVTAGVQRAAGSLGEEQVTNEDIEHAELRKSLESISDPVLARAARWSHQASCKICRAKEQRLRAGAPVWTMEAARLHRSV